VATDDQQVLVAGTAPAPAAFRVPGNGQIRPKAVRAVYDGSAAATFIPVLRIVSDGGVIVAEATAPVVAAGGSAAVTWFPGAELDEPGNLNDIGVAVETVFYDTVNANVPLTMSTTLAAGTAYVVVVEGTFSLWNSALATGTPEANAQFPGSGAGRVSLQVGLDADTCFAIRSGSAVPIGHSALLTFSLDNGGTFAHVEPVGGPYTVPVTGHLYRFAVTGQGHPLIVQLGDINPPDNYGKLKVTLQVPSGTGTGSGAGSLVPPTDATLNGEILTVVSGVPGWAANAATGTISDITSSAATITVSSPTGPTTNVDLPTTGVGAATYGDATHVPQIAVDARGRITAASNVAVSAGSGTISDITSTGGTITVGAPTGPTTNVDLPASGVTAASYGDASHVGQFTVDAEGRLTAAAAIAISGIAGAGFTTLFDSTLGADAATIDTGANGVGQGSQHLLVLVIARNDAAAVADSVNLTLNNDSGANYDRQTLRAVATTVTATTVLANNAWGLQAPGASAGAGRFGTVVLFIPAYTQTTALRSGYALYGVTDPTTANNRIEVNALGYRSTVAVSRIALAHGGGTVMKAGTRLTVYGMG